jgi:hypothetical protein
MSGQKDAEVLAQTGSFARQLPYIGADKLIDQNGKLSSCRDFHRRIWAGEVNLTDNDLKSSMAGFIGNNSYRICGKHNLKKH